MTNKKTHEQFVQEVYGLVSDEYTLLSQYSKAKLKVKMQHNSCGHIYYVEASSFLRGARCPSCANKIRGNGLKTKSEDFINKVKELVGNEYEFLEEYNGTDYKILARHNICGHEYKIRPSGFLRGSRCPICSRKEKSKNQTFSQDEFCNRVKALVGNEYLVLGEYMNSQTKIKFKHVACGNEFEMLPGNFLHQRQRCPNCGQIKCRITQTRTQEEFKREVYDLVKDEYSVIGTYKTSEIKIRMKHNLCGYEYEVKPGNFINNNRRCPLCYKLNRGKKTYFTSGVVYKANARSCGR